MTENEYEVVAKGERFVLGSLRVMVGFARALERHGISVERCQVRRGAVLAVVKREVWA